MVEAAHKHLKYQYLFKKDLYSLEDVVRYMEFSVRDHSNKPLYDRSNRQTKNTFRLIKAYSKSKKEPIFFLTNIHDMPVLDIASIYKKRWDIEVFFKFLKQEMNLTRLVSYHPNGIEVMLYMILIASMLILIYKRQNKIEGYKMAKLIFLQELEMEIIQEILSLSGKKFKPPPIKKGKQRGFF